MYLETPCLSVMEQACGNSKGLPYFVVKLHPSTCCTPKGKCSYSKPVRAIHPPFTPPYSLRDCPLINSVTLGIQRCRKMLPSIIDLVWEFQGHYSPALGTKALVVPSRRNLALLYIRLESRTVYPTLTFTRDRNQL